MAEPAIQNPSEVTIIGAGIVGVCCAINLLERGIKVTIVERDEIPRSASYGNSGSISPFASVPMSMPGAWRKVPKWLLDPNSPLAIRKSHFPRFIPWGVSFLRNSNINKVLKNSEGMAALSRGNIELYKQLLAGTGQEHLVHDTSTIYASRDPRRVNIDSLDFQLRKKQGAVIESLNSEHLHQLEPALSAEFRAGVVVHGQARAASPGDLRSALETKALSLGALLRRSSVQKITPSDAGAWLVKFQGEEFVTPAVLICAGAWSHKLLCPLGIRLPIEQEFGYHIECDNAGVTVNNFILDVDHSVSCSSMIRGVRFGSFADFIGPTAPLNWRRTKTLVLRAKQMFPDIRLDHVAEWGGPRPSFPDSLPILGAVPGYRNLYAAFGHAHFGLTMAPVTGRVISRIISGEAPGVDLEPYSLSRF